MFFNNYWKKLTEIDFQQSAYLLKSLSNCIIILLAQILCIGSLILSLLSVFMSSPSFFVRLSVCRGKEKNWDPKIWLYFKKLSLSCK